MAEFVAHGPRHAPRRLLNLDLKSATGRTKYTIDSSSKRSSKVFGANGLKVGKWWPKQVCALQDGAHGSSQGGIAGTQESGATSVVISGGDDYDDNDCGDTIWYCGSGHRNGDQPLTNGTKSLIKSWKVQLPIRLIRSFKCRSWYAPHEGYRYDGLYKVAWYGKVFGSEGCRVWKFKLERLPDQDRIKLDISSHRNIRDEMTAEETVESRSRMMPDSSLEDQPEEPKPTGLFNGSRVSESCIGQGINRTMVKDQSYGSNCRTGERDTESRHR